MSINNLALLRGVSVSRLSARIGWIVVVATILTSIVVVLGASSPTWLGKNDVNRLLWMLPVVIAACAGLSLMRACRLANCIEEELLRASRGGSWRKARPLVSNNPIAAAWNSLLEQAIGRSDVPSNAATHEGGAEPTGYLARAMRSLPMGVAIADINGKIRMANLPLAALTGLESLEQLEGMDVLKSLRIDDSVDAQEAHKRLSINARSVTFQLRRGVESVDGVMRITRNRLAGRDGDADGFVWTVQDITQQVIATEARDQFLNTASHELRTPLANLKAYAEALAIEDGIDIEQQKEFCNIINDESSRLARLVDELLAVGQMEAGSIVLNRSEVDFSRVLHEAIEYIRPNQEKKKQLLEVNISPKLPVVIGDKDKLQAALVNLLGNAVKYTPEGGEIRLRASTDGGSLNIEVQDTGVGIAAQDIDKIFDKFYRATDSRVVNETGNGLGLAFAREIVRRHSGEITVQSEFNEGSTFVMSLPINERTA